MGKYIKYKRISEMCNPEMIQEHFDNIIKEGCEIIHYNEIKLDKDKINVVIVYGKLNEGNGLLIL